MRVLFVLTSMPVGGAEVLLANLARRLDRERFEPEIACLKEPGPLGEELARELPVHSPLLSGKYDVRVLPRLTRLMKRRGVGAVVTVGAGDKMFWGRLAARAAGVPVVACALHSTGWPDGVGRLNRMLTPLTDAFIGVAAPHGRHLVEHQRFPAAKVHVIPNGVDTERFAPLQDRAAARRRLGLGPAAPVVAILAALRPEKNHELFLQAAHIVLQRVPDARFLVIGDGPRRAPLEELAGELGLRNGVTFCGARSDVAEILPTINVLALTSHNEANPVSILEAMSCGVPVVTTDVGSVSETVRPGVTGLLSPPGDAPAFAQRLIELLDDPLRAAEMGSAARRLVVADWSLDAMVQGYERLLVALYEQKTGRTLAAASDPAAAVGELVGEGDSGDVGDRGDGPAMG